jgi:RNA polymerase sigma factor (sigma-70 family)
MHSVEKGKCIPVRKKNPSVQRDGVWMTQPPGEARVDELFDAHSRALLLYARQWVGRFTAEDVVQRVFVRLLSQGKLPAEPRTWLFRCVRNDANDLWRSERRRGRREQAAATDVDAWFVPRPQDALDAREAQQALEELPDELREVVALRLWSGLTLGEIAEVTGVVVSTAYKRYEAAIELLREKLEKPCRNPKK